MRQSGYGLRAPAASADRARAGKAPRPCGPAVASHRGGGRIDAGLLAADADRPGRHRHARLRAARRGERLVEPAHVGEARLEAQEIDNILGRGMAAHHLRGAQARVGRHVAQVRAVITAVGDFDLDPLAVGHQCATLFPRFAQQRGERLRIGLRPEDERQIVHAGHHIDDARPRGRTRGHRPDALLASQGRRRRRFAQQRQFAQPVNRALQLNPVRHGPRSDHIEKGALNPKRHVNKISINSI